MGNVGHFGSFDRSVRLASVIAEELDALLRCEVRDPALFATRITRVEMSSRGARARVWFVADSNPGDIEVALGRAAGFLRSRLAESLGTKRTPELVFRFDPVSRVEVESIDGD